MDKVRTKLEELVSKGVLVSWKIVNVDEDGNVGRKSKYRNSERMVLVFPSGETLSVDTFCSGIREDTCFV
jgi:hypothetical protein